MKYLFSILTIGISLVSCQQEVAPIEKPLSEELNVFLKETTQDLGLNTRQSKVLNDALHEEADNYQHPGFLWLVARHLHENLPEQDKKNLLQMINAVERQLMSNGVCIPLGFELNFRHPLHTHPGMIALLLTEEQKPVFVHLVTPHQQQAEELIKARKEGKLSPEEFHVRMQQNFTALMHKLLTGLLTNEQRMKLGSMLQHQAKQREQFIKESFHMMARVLELNPEQLHKIVSISIEIEKRKGMLMEKMKTGELNEDEFRKILQESCTHAYAALEGILDKRQLEIVKIYRALSFRPLRQLDDPNG